MRATAFGDTAMGRERDYWRAKLAGLRGSSGLPLDFTRPEVYAHVPCETDFRLPADVEQGLLKLTGDSPFLLYVALAAALNVCLHKYSGGETVVVGSPARRRQTPRPPNAVAVVSGLSGRTTFRELLMGVRATLLEAYAEQAYDFRQLLGDLRLDHVENKCPLFDVVLALEEIHGELPHGLRNDVTITFARKDGGLAGHVEFNGRLFTRDGIERFKGHYAQALGQGPARPEARVGDISIITEGERRQLLVEWNDTREDYPRDACVHHLFERQAAATPDVVALSFGRSALTYAELDERADRLARRLRSLGVGPETIVGLCAERSIEMVVGLLGVLKAGGAYLPLDPAYPPDRLSFMMEDASVSVLLTQERLRERMSPRAARVLCLDADWGDAPGQGGGRAPTGGATFDNLAYVIYTSGSTGRPKGVGVEHRGLCNLVVSQHEVFGVRQGVRSLQFASLSFDASVEEIFLALCTGATLCLAPAESLLPGPELIELLGGEGINAVTLPPSALLAMPTAELPELKTIVAAGEACPAEVVERWAPGRRFVNAYGPTEVTVMASGAEARAGEGRPHIGRPIGNKSIHILDGAGSLVPVGVAGELYVGGDGVARGYLGRPGLTAERFVPDPFSPVPGSRLYRTGDLARRRPDGNVEFLGRLDHQVKVRGYRIELEEIEARLGQHPAVARCVVVARADGSDERLVAYVVGRGGELPGAGELRGFVAERLPDYMLPSAFVTLDELPLSPNGKVDRKALPAPDAPRERGAGTPLRTQTEGVVSALWAEVLGLESVGAEDNFFELGGHSLLATRVLSRVREAFKVELPIRTIFESPTVAQLARHIEEAAAGRASVAPPIRRAPRSTALPLSFGQQRLWVLHRLDPTTPLYNIPGAMRLTGPLDAAAMERSFTEIVRRHEALRTTFEADEAGRPVQVIAPPTRFELPVIDLGALPADEREAEAESRANEEARRPFDLARGPLLRATLLRLGPQDHVLLFAMHHIVSDGWSLGILAREVSALYEAFSAGEPSPLAELPVQYADFACWQREWLTGDVLGRQLSYWKGQLESAPPRLDLPFARPRPPVSAPRGAMHLVRLPEALMHDLRALSRREGVTLYMTLLAAYQALLYRYSGQPDVVVGSPIANRDRPEVEGLIGFFINVLALRTDLSGNPTFEELLARVRETTLGAYAHRDVPFEKIVSELQLEREPGFAPLFQAVFVLQNMPLSSPRLTRLTFGGVRIDKGTTQADLYLSLMETEDGMSGVLKYNTDIFDAPTAARIGEDYEALLKEVAARPETRVLEIGLRPEAGAGRAASQPSQALSYRDDQFAF